MVTVGKTFMSLTRKATVTRSFWQEFTHENVKQEQPRSNFQSLYLERSGYRYTDSKTESLP